MPVRKPASWHLRLLATVYKGKKKKVNLYERRMNRILIGSEKEEWIKNNNGIN
jgi:uncharacterized protein YgiM (DUF1202 family)